MNSADHENATPGIGELQVKVVEGAVLRKHKPDAQVLKLRYFALGVSTKS